LAAKERKERKNKNLHPLRSLRSFAAKSTALAEGFHFENQQSTIGNQPEALFLPSSFKPDGFGKNVPIRGAGK